jgi:hypothetical protein
MLTTATCCWRMQGGHDLIEPLQEMHAVGQAGHGIVARHEEDFLAGFQLFGTVTGDLGEAQQAAIFSIDGIDHHVGPEARTILAYAPALVLELALAQGDGQVGLGQAGQAIGDLIEDRVMLADDFLVGITLEAPGTGVPAGHHAIRTQQVDGVILDALYQQAVSVRGTVFGQVILLAHVGLSQGRLPDLRCPSRDRRPQAVFRPVDPAMLLKPPLYAGRIEAIFRDLPERRAAPTRLADSPYNSPATFTAPLRPARLSQRRYKNSSAKSSRSIIHAAITPAAFHRPALGPLLQRRIADPVRFPFFYWYQFAWVPLTSLIIWLVYRDGLKKGVE